MKIQIVFCLSENQLCIYKGTSNAIELIDIIDISDELGFNDFKNKVKDYKKSACYLLLDVSCEDYQEETLPHIKGKDKKLLISRKLNKYFDSNDFARSDLIGSIKQGRHNDIYMMSGIVDTVFIQSVLDVFINSEVEIAGVYTFPLVAIKLIAPIEQKKQVMLVSYKKTADDQYVCRQTYFDDNNLLFNRNSSFVSGPDGAGFKLHKEVEKSWQYLNNKRMISQTESLQVLVASTSGYFNNLDLQDGGLHCEFLSLDTKELFLNHGVDPQSKNIDIIGLAAFFLLKHRQKEHYRPKNIVFYRKHQQIKRFLSAACIVMAIAAIGFSGFNINSAMDATRTNRVLEIKSINMQEELDALSTTFHYDGDSPQQMQALVDLANNIVVPEALPKYVFSILSNGFSSFNDLELNEIKWKVQSVNGDHSDMGGTENDNSEMMSNPGNMQSDISLVMPADADIQPTVVVNLQGSIKNFDGNYRRALERVGQLLMELEEQDAVEKAVALKLPLDIDPSINTSRSLAENDTPIFEIDVVLKTRVL